MKGSISLMVIFLLLNSSAIAHVSGEQGEQDWMIDYSTSFDLASLKFDDNNTNWFVNAHVSESINDDHFRGILSEDGEFLLLSLIHI